MVWSGFLLWLGVSGIMLTVSNGFQLRVPAVLQPTMVPRAPGARAAVTSKPVLLSSYSSATEAPAVGPGKEVPRDDEAGFDWNKNVSGRFCHHANTARYLSGRFYHHAKTARERSRLYITQGVQTAGRVCDVLFFLCPAYVPAALLLHLLFASLSSPRVQKYQ